MNPLYNPDSRVVPLDPSFYLTEDICLDAARVYVERLARNLYCVKGYVTDARWSERWEIAERLNGELRKARERGDNPRPGGNLRHVPADMQKD